MLAYQPGDQLRLPRIEPVELGEFQHVFGAENRVIAAAAFSDIVKQGGDEDKFRMGQPRPQLNAQRMAAAGLFFREAFQL